MPTPVVFYGRSIHTIAPDRIYRIQSWQGALYFLRVGGQFDPERGASQPGHAGAKAVAGAILNVAELLFNDRKQQELAARDLSRSPDDLIAIHPDNFKVTADDVDAATLLAPSWLALLRRHYGRWMLTLGSGTKWQFHFEHISDMKTAADFLPGFLGERLVVKAKWNERRQRFEKC